MCTLLDQLFLDCGTSQAVEFVVLAGGVAFLIVLLIRP